DIDGDGVIDQTWVYEYDDRGRSSRDVGHYTTARTDEISEYTWDNLDHLTSWSKRTSPTRNGWKTPVRTTTSATSSSTRSPTSTSTTRRSAIASPTRTSTISAIRDTRSSARPASPTRGTRSPTTRAAG